MDSTIDSLIDELIDPLLHTLIDWFVDPLIHSLIPLWRIDYSLADSLIRLIDWSHESLVALFIYRFVR